MQKGNGFAVVPQVRASRGSDLRTCRGHSIRL